jgi:hypothetical protein
MMRRTLKAGLVAVATGVALLSIPIPTLAADPAGDDSLVFQVNADLTIPAETQRDTVIAIRSDVTVAGDVGTVIVIDGSATLTGARVDTLIVTGGTADIDEASIVGTVRTLDATYRPATGAAVGSYDSIQPGVIAVALAPLAAALWLGFALAYLVAGLVVAAIGGRQLRQAGASLTAEPGTVAISALVLLIAVPVLMVALMVSVVGIPAGLALLFVVTPLIWFVGSVAVAVRIGDWTLLTLRGRVETSHPLVAALIGLVVIGVVSVIPFVGFLVGLAGAGAVFLVAWRAAFGGRAPRTATPQPGPVAA